MWRSEFLMERWNVVTGPASGPPLVMLHGVSRRWQTFQPLLPALSPFFQITLIDHRGHGESARSSKGEYLVVDYIRDAVGLLERMGRPTFLYGHSLGAMTAAGVAAERPDLVTGLVLEDPPFETMGRRIVESRLHSQFQGMQRLAGSPLPVSELAREMSEIRLVDPQGGSTLRLGDLRDAASLRFSAACLKQVDPRVFDPIVAGRWLEGFDRAAILRRIDCPTLLLQADVAMGGMWPEDDAASVEAQLCDVARVRFPGVGHLIHGARTQDLTNCVLAFLCSVGENGRPK